MTSFFFRLQFYLMLGASTYLSLTPSPARVMATTNDKLLHFIGYFGLYISADIAFSPGRRRPQKVMYLFAYSFLIEVIQHFVPNRTFSLPDMAANLAGLAAAAILCTFVRKKRLNR